MSDRKSINEETMERLRSDPWLDAFVASRRRRPFARQRARDLATLAERAAGATADRDTDEVDEVTDGSAQAPSVEVVCGGVVRMSCSASKG